MNSLWRAWISVWLIKCANKVANTGADFTPKLANTAEYLAPLHSTKFDQKCWFSRIFRYFRVLWTIRYEADNLTPKRGVGGSNPLMDASEQRRKPLFSRVFGFSYMKRHEKALSLYEIKFYSKIWFLTTPPESNGCYKTKSPANF